MSMKNSSDTIRNRTRDLPTYSALPQPNALPRTPNINIWYKGKNFNSSQNFALVDLNWKRPVLLPSIPCEGIPPAISNFKLFPKKLFNYNVVCFAWVFFSKNTYFCHVWVLSLKLYLHAFVLEIFSQVKSRSQLSVYCWICDNDGYILKILCILTSTLSFSTGTATPSWTVSCFCPGIISQYFNNAVYLFNSI